MIKIIIGFLAIVVGSALFYRSFPHSSEDVSKKEAPQFSGGSYEDYNQEENITSGDIVLFFHADRCPTCRAFEKKVLKSGIPSGLHIRQVDYDTADDLKKKYSITTQTSFVHINSNGDLISRRIGGRDINSILDKLADEDSQKPRESARENNNTETKMKSNTPLAKAHFAGGCFWCIEGPLEALNGVEEVISGYIGGTEENATYDKVARGKTQHRESVEVQYYPDQISFEKLLTTFLYQIDPTDPGGQFADRGYQYTTAIFVQNKEEEDIATKFLKDLQDSGKFEDDIVVAVEKTSSFYPAEAEHQNFNQNNSEYYEKYKKGSGRSDFIEDTRSTEEENRLKEEKLTDLQKEILFNEGTERPFDNAYRDNHDDGIYVDVIDGTPLFSSKDKFDSGTGWPSFSKPIDEDSVDEEEDTRYGMQRTEIENDDGNHLGHLFNDGPAGGKRYCINSAALEFIPLSDMEQKGYGDYIERVTTK